MDARRFAIAVQWEPNGLICQEDGLTLDEAFDGYHALMSAKRRPHRCAIALLVPR